VLAHRSDVPVVDVGGSRFQVGQAAFAAATAAFRSEAPDIGTVESNVPSTGEITSSVLEPEDGHQVPPIKLETGAYFMR
jgi:hypothetical protein